MSFITKLLKPGSGLVSSVGTILDNLTTTKGEKMQLELELKKAEYQFQTDALNQEVLRQQNVLADKQSARQMATAIQTSQTTGRLNRNISAFLALITTGLSFALFFVILFFSASLEERGKDISIYILGVLCAIVTQVFSFYFGASLSPNDKLPSP